MRWKSWMLGLALTFAAIAAEAQDTLRAYGLEFTLISNAVMTIDAPYGALKVAQTNAPDCYGGIIVGTNEVAGTNYPFGVSVLLGEAQSGVFIYPYDDGCRADNMSMWGNAYGNVNGETNRLISSIKGTRTAWGNYRIEVDLTPLGATSYTYQVWSHGYKTMHVTNQGPFSAINTYNLSDSSPRANPFYLAEAGPAALIEFPYGTEFSMQEDGSSGPSGAGDRILIIAEGATNQVNYVSRVDVFGSENLPAFAINDARIGMFGLPHKALGSVNFSASNGRLTASRFEQIPGSGLGNGVMVDFKKNALRWVVQTEPFSLEAPDAQFVLHASVFAFSSDRVFPAFCGPVGFVSSNSVRYLQADFGGDFESNCVLRVFRSNVLSGSIHGPNRSILATLTETNPLVTGWSVSTQAFSIAIAEPTRITGYEGTVLEGDRFEFAPDQSYPRMACITDAPLLAQGVTSFTIVSEVTEEAPVPEPRLQIERTPTGLVVSWPYLGWFYAVMRTNIASEPTEYFAPLYRDFTSYFELSPTNDAGFISLRHYFYYYSRPWNTD